jgi:hypothetical protein
VWVTNDAGLKRLPASLPRARLIDRELAAVDLKSEGLLMATAVVRAGADARKHHRTLSPSGKVYGGEALCSSPRTWCNKKVLSSLRYGRSSV